MIGVQGVFVVRALDWQRGLRVGCWLLGFAAACSGVCLQRPLLGHVPTCTGMPRHASTRLTSPWPFILTRLTFQWVPFIHQSLVHDHCDHFQFFREWFIDAVCLTEGIHASGPFIKPLNLEIESLGKSKVRSTRRCLYSVSSTNDMCHSSMLDFYY